MSLTAPQKYLLNEGIMDWLEKLLQKTAKSPKRFSPEEISKEVNKGQQILDRDDPSGQMANSPFAQAVKKRLLSFVGIQESRNPVGESIGIHVLTSVLALVTMSLAAIGGNVGIAIVWGIIAAINSAKAGILVGQEETEQPRRSEKPPQVPVRPKEKPRPGMPGFKAPQRKNRWGPYS